MKKPRLVRGFFMGDRKAESPASRASPLPHLSAFLLEHPIKCRRGLAPARATSVIPYTENRATIEFRSTAKRDSSWLAALVWFAPVDV